MFLQIEYQPIIHQRRWYDRGVRIAVFTEIKHSVEELITFSSIFGPQKLCNLTARLNNVSQYQLEYNERGLVCNEACPKLPQLL